jgi:hypothetical protein
MRIGRASEFESDARPMRIWWTEWSQKLRNNNDDDNNYVDKTMNAIRHALTTMDAILASLSLLQHAEFRITATHQDLPHQFPTKDRNSSSFSILFTGRVV